MQELKPLDIQYFENLAHQLQAGENNIQVAMVHHQGITYFSLNKAQRGPSSATVKLIQGLFDQHQDLSFFILRKRIWTTETLGPMALGMVRVAAKRITQVQSRDYKIKTDGLLQEVGRKEAFIYPARSRRVEADLAVPAFLNSDREGIEWSVRLAQSVVRGDVLHDHNRPIGAVLCAQDGQVLGWSTNSAALNKTLHAEVQLMQDYFQRTGRGLPPAARIYVSLKPCKMCAGMIAESCDSLAGLRVVYAENDVGELSKNTALEGSQELFL